MKFPKTLVASLALCGVAACSSNPVALTPRTPATATPVPTATPTTSPTTQYVQIERLSRPAIKEAFESFQDHQKSNAVEPYNDPTIAADIVTTEDAIRPPVSGGTDYGKTIASVVYPDEYLVNLAGSTPSGADPYYFLSTEVSGGTAFGGRAPNDDVIGLELGILFGGTLPALGLAKEDNLENNCIDTQNLKDGADTAKLSTSTFPYLPAPR